MDEVQKTILKEAQHELECLRTDVSKNTIDLQTHYYIKSRNVF